MDGNGIVNQPKAGDPDRAEDLLDEIQRVLNKRGACLIHKPDCMVLAVARTGDSSWRAIAQVRLIAGAVGVTPGRIDWRPVDWSAEKTGLPV